MHLTILYCMCKITGNAVYKFKSIYIYLNLKKNV